MLQDRHRATTANGETTRASSDFRFGPYALACYRGVPSTDGPSAPRVPWNPPHVANIYRPEDPSSRGKSVLGRNKVPPVPATFIPRHSVPYDLYLAHTNTVQSIPRGPYLASIPGTVRLGGRRTVRSGRHVRSVPPMRSPPSSVRRVVDHGTCTVACLSRGAVHPGPTGPGEVVGNGDGLGKIRSWSFMIVVTHLT